ncbi:MAG: cyclodeaminase/cyclohydrolase family protein [Vicinamibacterales bacterium]
MSPYDSQPFSDVLDRIAAPTASPGGGSAAALAGALGAAVGQMCAGLPRTRHGTPEERARLDEAVRDFAAHRARLVALAADDEKAVAALMKAARRPHGTAAADEARAEALADATRVATRVPLATLRVCAAALERLRDVAAMGARVAASDVGVAIGLLKTSADGAASNVRANLHGLDDEAFVRETTRQLSRLLDGVARAAHAALAALQD